MTAKGLCRNLVEHYEIRLHIAKWDIGSAEEIFELNFYLAEGLSDFTEDFPCLSRERSWPAPPVFL